MDTKARHYLRAALGAAFLALAVAWAAAPLLWALICSIKQPLDVFRMVFIPFLQFQPTLEHWRMELTSRGPEIGGGLFNSVMVAMGSSALSLLLAAPFAYALARLTPPASRRNWWLWLISQRFMPPVVLIIPFFLMMRTAGLLDTPLALIAVHATMNAPFAALLLQDVFAEFPPDLEEAALMDGCDTSQVLRMVVMPLALPALAATFMLCVALSWNEFVFALTLTYRKAVTMPVVIAGSEHTQGPQFWYVATRSLIALIPPAIMALFAQKLLIRGLTLGAVKG